MNRIIPTIGLLVGGFAVITSSASAQYYVHDHHAHAHHQPHAYYNYAPYHGGHGYHNDYHGGYHASDYLTYPVHPPVYVDAAPIYGAPLYGELAYVDSLGGDYDCPNSSYCPQAANEYGQPYAPEPLRSQPNEYAYGPTHGLNDSSHVGHDHSGHDHGNHSHDGQSHGPVNPNSQDPASTLGTPDRQPMAAPSLPNRNTVSEFPRYETPRDRPTQPSSPPTSDGPIQMDGPPPSLTVLPEPLFFVYTGWNDSGQSVSRQCVSVNHPLWLNEEV